MTSPDTQQVVTGEQEAVDVSPKRQIEALFVSQESGLVAPEIIVSEGVNDYTIIVVKHIDVNTGVVNWKFISVFLYSEDSGFAVTLYTTGTYSTIGIRGTDIVTNPEVGRQLVYNGVDLETGMQYVGKVMNVVIEDVLTLDKVIEGYREIKRRIKNGEFDKN